jgi:tetratricopeptide (TPR) repeat protein
MSSKLAFTLGAALLAVSGIAALAAAPPNLTKALETQRRLSAERPQDPAVFNDLGNLLVMASQNAEAETAYRQAVELDPQRVSALFNLGLLLQERGERREALRLYKQVVELEPSHAWAHYQLGALYESWDSESRAIGHYARAFALDPQLAFPEVNPHIVENELVTEAMLQAYRGDYAPPQAPKVYEDPARIANLLVPPPVVRPADAGAPANSMAGQTDASGRAGQAQRPGQAQGATGNRVLRPGDLDPRSTAGQATPQAGARAPYYDGRRGSEPGTGQMGQGFGVPGAVAPGTRTLRDFGQPQNPRGGQPGTVITPPPGGVYYRPEPPSTGRLDLRLVPGRPQEAERRAAF